MVKIFVSLVKCQALEEENKAATLLNQPESTTQPEPEPQPQPQVPPQGDPHIAIANQQIGSFRQGTGLLANILTTHNAGVIFCDQFGANLKHPGFGCSIPQGDDPSP